jgi:hypothetical protein
MWLGNLGVASPVVLAVCAVAANAMPQSQMISLVAVTSIALADIAALPIVDTGESGCHHWRWTMLILLLEDVPPRTCGKGSKGVLSYTDATIFSLAHQIQE